jgi:ParB family chromosome partitioning protein
VQRLADADVTVIEHPARGQGPVALDNLVDGDGNVLDAESHAGCPGHAAAVSEYRPDEVAYYCADPTANGHQGRWAGAVTTPMVVGDKMTEEAKAARREVIEILFPTALCARAWLVPVAVAVNGRLGPVEGT